MAEYLQHLHLNDLNVISQDAIDSIKLHLKDHMDHMKLYKVKLFDQGGKVIFSTVDGEEGTFNRAKYFNEVIAKGETYSKVVKKDTLTHYGALVKSDVQEVYIPLMKDGKFLGAFEIYYDITVEMKSLNSVMKKSLILIFAIVFLFFIASVAILFKVKKLTQKKEALDLEINRSHDNLEQKVKQRTAFLEQAIDERIEHEEALNRMIAEKTNFINRLSHDLKTPITPLLVLMPLLRKKLEDPALIKIVDISIQDINHLKDMVIKTLKLSRATSEHKESNLEAIRLKSEVDTYIEKREFLISKKKLQIFNSIPEDLAVVADRNDLEELFYNLITNAIKYSDASGEIRIDAFEKEGTVTVSVEDEGRGLSSDQISRVFDEFYKVDESRHELDSSGLGLSICKGIVEKHGGNIWAESPGEGKGSTFFFAIKSGNPEDGGHCIEP